MSPKKILWAIDNPDGGAGVGLSNLTKQGFFENTDTQFVMLEPGSGNFPQLMNAAVEQNIKIHALTDKHYDALPKHEHAIRAWKLARLAMQFRPEVAILSLEGTNLVGQPVFGFVSKLPATFPRPRILTYLHSGPDLPVAPLTAKLLKNPHFQNTVDGVLGDCDRTIELSHLYLGKPGWSLPLNSFTPGIVRAAPTEVPSPFRLLSVGRLDDVKNFDELMKAVADLNKKYNHNVHLSIAGEGTARKKLQALISELGMSGHVTLLGSQNEQQLAHLRARSHAYAQPSKTEAFSLTTAEALADCMPLVATNFLGVQYYGRDEQNMLIIPGDPQKADAGIIANTLDKLITNYVSLCSKLSEGAHYTTIHVLGSEPVRLLRSKALNEAILSSEDAYEAIGNNPTRLRAGMKLTA